MCTDMESVPDGAHTGGATEENHCETGREKPVKRCTWQPKLP